MVARRRKQNADRSRLEGESGQSVLEFMFAVPAILVLIIMMVRVNTAIQVSIVNQKYARAQALFLAYNSPYYPELHFRKRMMDLGSNQLIIGVSSKLAGRGGASYRPDPVIYKITRPGAPRGNDSDPVADKRDRVRIRSTVSLCTQLNVVQMGGGETVPYNPADLQEGATFPFCRGYFNNE